MIYDANGQNGISRNDVEALFPPIDEGTADYIQVFDKITTIGDSLMAGYAATSNMTISSADAKQRGANWISYMALDINREITNLAVGNTCTTDWRNSTQNADITQANIDTNCYIVALGVNDSRQSQTVGTSADIKSDKSQNANSFYGNMDWIVRTLNGYNATAHILLLTIPGEETQKDGINEAIRYIADLYSYAHCIDLDEKYAKYFTDADSFIKKNLYYGHYNAITYKLISCYIKKAINEYIYANYSKFKNIPYKL